MPRRIVLLGAGLVLAGTLAALAPAGGSTYSWHLTPTGSDARLRGLAAVSSDVAWASGSAGTVLRTTDRGATWSQVGPPGTQDLQFRDIEAFDANRAVILSIGSTTDAFRIYVTSDGGRTWALTFVNTDPSAFYDCMTFFDEKRGLALSDPPDGQKFRIIATNDGGRSWHVVDPAGMPPALPGEFAFAASGQCLTSKAHTAWFGTGGGAQARVFRSGDRGQTWTVSPTPIASGPTSGIFALAFKDENHGLAVGGDFLAPTASPDNFAKTGDSGRSWALVPGAPAEYRSGATWVDGHTALAVGPSGSDVSTDHGTTWTRFDSGSFDTVDCATPNACWASGEQGRVAYLVKSH
ncbi:MAG TPA: hypothetical protein VE688_01370 [Gaiellaceae bacterium]|nr:hypothetical protein [Gaiellaceae bacterium]